MIDWSACWMTRVGVVAAALEESDDNPLTGLGWCRAVACVEEWPSCGVSHGEKTLPEFEEVLAGSDSTAGCLGGDPRSVMALEDQLVVHVADGL